jgi:hypothetical protein
MLSSEIKLFISSHAAAGLEIEMSEYFFQATILKLTVNCFRIKYFDRPLTKWMKSGGLLF